MSKAIIGMDKSKSFRIYLTVTTDSVEQIRKIHGTTPLATATLGRVFTAAGLMGIMMKNRTDKLTIKFSGDGQAKQVLATADGKGRVKGFIANPAVDLPLTPEGKLDVGGAVGLGEVTVIRDMALKEPYVGTIALVSGEIADDLTAYFYLSEQQNSSVALGVKIERDYTVGAAGGMIIQMLPGADEAAVTALEEMIGKMEPITSLTERVTKSATGKSQEGMLEDLMEQIFAGMPEEYRVQRLESRDILWHCDCAEERLEQVLMTLGKAELTSMIEEDGEAEMQCQFCLKKYHFDREKLERIREGITS